MKGWKGDRSRIGVEGSLNRRVLELCEAIGFVLTSVRGLGHLSRQTQVFLEEGPYGACAVEVTIESLPLESAKPTRRGHCGDCGACDGLRFRQWRERLAVIPGGGSAGDEKSPRFALIDEIHRDRARRHPLGIAERLSDLIGCLHADDDPDSITLLAELEQDERRSIEINGERNLECCAAGAKAFRGAPS